MRKVNLEILREWTKGKTNPNVKLAALSDVSLSTLRVVFKGQSPKSEKIRLKIALALGVDEDDLFPYAA